MPSSAPKKVYAKMIDYLSYNPVPIPSYNLSADPNHLAEEGEDFLSYNDDPHVCHKTHGRSSTATLLIFFLATLRHNLREKLHG